MSVVWFFRGLIPVWASLLSFQVSGGDLFAVEEAFVVGSVWRWLRCCWGTSSWSWTRPSCFLRFFWAGPPPWFWPISGTGTPIKSCHGCWEAAWRPVILTSGLRKQRKGECRTQKLNILSHTHELTYMCCFSLLDLFYNFCHSRSLLPVLNEKIEITEA